MSHMASLPTYESSHDPVNLLVVDDDDMVRLFLRTALKTPAYHIDEAADGLQALQMLNDNHYALVIVDLGLPGMDGEELIKQIRTKNEYIGLIVLTAETNIDVSFRLLEQYNISDYLMKPMFKELKQQISFSVKNTLNKRHFLLCQDRYINNLESLRYQAEEAKSLFLSQMNHELNTPMNVILGFGQLLDNVEQGLNPKQKGYVKQIVKAGWSLMDMIEKILKLSSVEFDTLNIKSQRICIYSLIAELCLHFQSDADKNDIQLVNLCHPLDIMGDSVQFRTVILSLLSNAIIYNHERGRVTISSELVDNEIDRKSVV